MLQSKAVKFTTLFFFIILFLIVYGLKLDTIPTSVHGDEGETALQAIEIMRGNVGLTGIGWFDLPLLSFLPHALTMAIFGENVLGNRLGSVVFGILTLPMFYLFVELLFSRRIALLATLFLGTSHLWIALSRLGMSYVQATFFLITTFYFVVHGLKTGHKRDFVFGGIFLALCFYSYYPARIAPFIIAPLFLFHIAKNIKKTFVYFLILFVSATIIFWPQGKFFLENPETFFSRTKTVYIFSEIGREWTNYNKSDIEVIWQQTKKTFNIFAGDNSTQYGYKGQLLDYLTIILFFLGIIYSIRFFSRTHGLLFIWLFIALLGQILTTIPTPIFLPRFVIGLPVLYILVALGIEMIIKPKVYKQFRLPIMSIIVLAIVITNLYTFFVLYPKQISGDLNARAATKIASYINALPKSYTVFFLTVPNLYSDFGTLRFLSPNVKKIDNKGNNNLMLDEQISNKTTSIYILYPHQKDELRQLTSAYPFGKTLEFKDIDGRLQFLVFYP